jgi:hypothetical protein
MGVRAHYRFMAKTPVMEEDTHFNKLSQGAQKYILGFWSKEKVELSNRQKLPVLAGIYGVSHFWLTVEELLTLIDK